MALDLSMTLPAESHAPGDRKASAGADAGSASRTKLALFAD